MAENEVLDVGSARRYRKWRHSLSDANATALDSAVCLYEEFSAVLQKQLRREPFYLVLAACGRERSALREAVATLKNRALARMIENAYQITGSTKPTVVAGKLAELLTDRVIARSTKYVLRQNRPDELRAALERAAVAKFESCKEEIASWLAASLQNQPVRRRPQRVEKSQRAPDALASTSLLRKETA